MSYRLPPILSLPSLDTAERAVILDRLFEPSVPLHTLCVTLLQQKSFSSYDDLVASVGVELSALANSASTSDTKWLESILNAHPRLGETEIDSAQSRAEQSHLQETHAEDAKLLSLLNAEYEKTFPGRTLRPTSLYEGRAADDIAPGLRYV